MTGHQWRANKDGNIFEHECFVEILFFMYLKKEYHHIWIVDIVQAQNRDNIIDDINIQNKDKNLFVCESKTGFKWKASSIIKKFYLSIRDNKATWCILFTKDRWLSLEELLTIVKEHDDESKFGDYLLSENSKTNGLKKWYILIQEIIKSIEIKDYVSSKKADLDLIYIPKIFIFLKKIQILHKSNKQDLLNRIKDNIPILSDNIRELNCLYNSISAKAFSDRSNWIPISKENIDKYLKENLDKEYDIIDVWKIASLWFGQVPDIFISKIDENVLPKST